jgi:endonuclease YncB( thermonuclease family)
MKTTLKILAILALSAAFAAPVTAQTPTKVYLNGRPTPVYFNDGDSFRVLEGPFKDSRARLAGFNTLESYGPVHQWGTWTPHELARYATLGTMNARKGIWHCTSEGNRDGYGRVLWDCPDLSIDQLRKGLAHAMTVTKHGAPPALVAAQSEAIMHKRGIWAHGVPPFVITSTHSADEWRGKNPYNRLISSVDGHTEKWNHTNTYDECQVLCQPALDYDEGKLVAMVQAMRGDEALTAALAKFTDPQLLDMATTFAKKGRLDQLKEPKHREVIERVFAAVRSSGGFTKSGTPSSCMVYVAFKRRYGATKATCLR